MSQLMIADGLYLLIQVFKAWASTISVHDEDRASKRLRTRIAYTQNSEEALEAKRQHCRFLTGGGFWFLGYANWSYRYQGCTGVRECPCAAWGWLIYAASWWGGDSEDITLHWLQESLYGAFGGLWRYYGSSVDI